jgi:hypothetical protein
MSDRNVSVTECLSKQVDCSGILHRQSINVNLELVCLRADTNLELIYLRVNAIYLHADTKIELAYLVIYWLQMTVGPLQRTIT